MPPNNVEVSVLFYSKYIKIKTSGEPMALQILLVNYLVS